MAEWSLFPEYSERKAEFGSLDAVFALQGERITSDPLSEVLRVELGGIRYYIKRYHGAGKGLRRFVGRPRVKAEWQNLRHFERWGIPTAPIVAHGLERQAGSFVRGALITQELLGTEDLAQLANKDDLRLRDRAWVARVSDQLAAATRVLHDHHFTHNDLKWRNLLVDEEGRLYLIDCPTGTFWWGPLLRHRIVKDLACLDKVAKYQLSRTQRLRFYLAYCKRARLNAADKACIRQMLHYFEGRE
ncbi:Lipopolysaccharide kinase (Kdo/WaaP) family protein [Pseudomonas cuatrocienegasensis]|uniref:Lipopolysaccharide kinase (Kdo/WaaP) family protein n=1 Tax=Pseudomonas cuatrocienegasensis TaxID=543360 RepID=A0ABY1BH25_9PSED|nr:MULTISPECIES: lipopolysaccharide kinase InaA family protein [Pseudomonas]OEC32926.1 heptose kinase [Pseudomonas sp. 21C1]SEQ84569.1 Lipopolysaccharide kinase (Kdo/WaaP) family protein [Pseudomonas cuatrocienegasensis]